ncbi:PREDICTED: RNA polymerase II subunit 5-mediating protein homolog isoform X2 [Tarenaya hassleriana]|uniref:RNA polymerase II subunit 5-mediating protein homolog isoform X2 n=1 Tax=Tarenaya hassleriana TaxID=28532 RepID=UPI00053C596C|nr:PREDICTED: RNA polymerase II subunit 5-mediating protein homolog isoform X2 [Tarenaya hassleriana]
MEAPAKGTVTPLASMFPEDEARKAAKRVEEKIGEKQNEMNRLDQFGVDNANLINLVKKLPDQLNHDVMVPFGKLAFFPGRLIHTNEFMVLLGENYYAERTSKQTVDVLKRRDKTLKSQLNSLKAEIEDLQTEASFFARTASEAAEGLVEIREEYVEESSSGTVTESEKEEPHGFPERENVKDEVKDDEYERILARLDQLEMEELKGENEDDRDEEHDSDTESAEYYENNVEVGFVAETNSSRVEYGESGSQFVGQSDRDVGERERSVPDKKSSGHNFLNREPRYSESLRSFGIGPRGEDAAIGMLAEKHQGHNDLDERMNSTGLTTQYFCKDKSSGGIHPQNVFGTSTNEVMEPTVSRGKDGTSVVGPQRNESLVQKPKPEFDSHKAFTGSIIEHARDLETERQSQVQSSRGSQPSKPVSRFKAQRR